jgi:signal transduction histidine kinase
LPRNSGNHAIFIPAEKSIQFDLEVKAEHMVQADRAMVQTVLRNLLSNALKFTPNGGRISIRSEGESDKLVIQVQDTGVGIKPEVLPKLFLGTKVTLVWEQTVKKGQVLD